MRPLFITLVALFVCSTMMALPAFGLDDTESQAATTVSESQEAPAITSEKLEVSACLSEGEAQAQLQSNDSWISVDVALLPAPSWNCNGCVEPSPCQNNFQCGFPQGYCIQNVCRCICDPDV